ncbi:MAG: globin family protein [Granulosicoccus sp.]
MTPEQKSLVKESWAMVLPNQEATAGIFYDRLFEQYPEVRPMFKGDIQEQGEKLMKMLDLAVNSLDDVESLIEPLKAAGKAHKGYGVAEADYQKVAASLLWTLEKGLGDAFTLKVREAWTQTYATLSGVMIEGAGYTVAEAAPVIKTSWFRSLFGAKAAT